MVDFNNAAGRLYTVLKDLKSKETNMTIQHALADMFNVDRNDIEQLLILNAEIVKLMEEAKELVLKQNVDHDLFLKPFVKIQRVFALGLNYQVQNTLEFLDPATMTGLEHCAELLSRTAKENIIEEATLQNLLHEISQLEKNVSESAINDDLKSLILDNLLEIKQAIQYYKIHGMKGIEKAVKNSLGSVQFFTFNNPVIEIKNEKAQKTVLDYISFIADLLSIVSVGLNIPMLKENISAFLLGAGK